MRFGSCLSIIMLAAGSFLGVSASALADGACCTVDEGCGPAADEAACNAMNSYFLPGESCEDDACGVGACCSPDSCVEAPAYPCFMGGRTYMGVGTTCLENACDIDIGACCNAGVCSEISPDDCAADGGTWLGGGTHCFNDPCDLGSCCAPGSCNETARFECDDAGGAFVEGVGCDAKTVAFSPRSSTAMARSGRSIWLCCWAPGAPVDKGWWSPGHGRRGWETSVVRYRADAPYCGAAVRDDTNISVTKEKETCVFCSICCSFSGRS